MSKQYRNSDLEFKQKHTFLCCPCFTKTRSASPSAVIDLSDNNEPYDYIVEKLTIRKVPLNLFATVEDLEKQSLNSAVIQPVMSQKPVKIMQVTHPVTEQKSSTVTFASYCKTDVQPDTQHLSHSHIAQPEPILAAIPAEPERELLCVGPGRHQNPQKVAAQDQESILVSQILNQHASLYTLDTKEGIPKDPERFRDRTAAVPESVKFAFSRQQQIQADVHKTCEPQVKSQAKRNMSPDIQQTINALGHAQKPHLPGVPPKNQKSVMPVICEKSAEKEFGNMFVLNETVEEKSSYELGCHPLANPKVFAGKKAYLNKRVCEHDEVLGVHVQQVSFDTPFLRNTAVEQSDQYVYPALNKSFNELPFLKNTSAQYSTECSDKCTMADEIDFIPATECANTDLVLDTSNEQCTEISQLKGQNLKWKIIIKHHSDKNKQEGKNTTTRTSSDSDSENDNINDGSPAQDR